MGVYDWMWDIQPPDVTESTFNGFLSDASNASKLVDSITFMVTCTLGVLLALIIWSYTMTIVKYTFIGVMSYLFLRIVEYRVLFAMESDSMAATFSLMQNASNYLFRR
jgi:hypothetical protein